MARLFGLVDLGVTAVVAVAIFLPARDMQAQPAIKADESAPALPEAPTQAHPGDAVAIEEFTRRLGDAGMKDWAAESAVRMADNPKDSPSRWRALIAASVAYIE